MDPRIIPFGWGLFSEGKEEEVIVIEREEKEGEEEEHEEEEEEEEEEERRREKVLPFSSSGLLMKASLLGSPREARYSGEWIIYIVLILKQAQDCPLFVHMLIILSINTLFLKTPATVDR